MARVYDDPLGLVSEGLIIELFLLDSPVWGSLMRCDRHYASRLGFYVILLFSCKKTKTKAKPIIITARSLCFSLPPTPHLCVFLSVSVSLSVSLSLSLSVPLSLSLCLCLSVCRSLCLCLSVCLSPPPPLPPFLSLSPLLFSHTRGRSGRAKWGQGSQPSV